MRLLAITIAFVGLCAAQEGTRVFIAHCQQCHDANSDAHAPLPEALAEMPWSKIMTALDTGTMKAFGDSLSLEEKTAVARYLGKDEDVEPPEMTGFCAPGAQPASTDAAWNGWGVDERNTRFQPESSGRADR